MSSEQTMSASASPAQLESSDQLARAPLMTAAELAAHRKRVIAFDDERDGRVALARALENDTAGVDALRRLAAIAEREIAEWQRYACLGSRDEVGRCGDATASRCDRLHRPNCPRRLIRLDQLTVAGDAVRRGFSAHAVDQWREGPPDGVLKWRGPVEMMVSAFAAGRYLVVLSGATGTGKTMAATMLALVPHARMLTAAQFAATNAYDGSLDRLCRRPALAIDDIGMEYLDAKGHFSSLLDTLVNGRYAARLPLVITTNLPAKAFRERCGERVADRIRECGRFLGLVERLRKRA